MNLNAFADDLNHFVEIRKLADETGKATQMITDITSDIQQEIESVSQQMDQIQNNTGRCINAMEKTEGIFREINVNITGVGSDIHNLERSVDELNRNKENIVDKFSDISSGTEELSVASQEIYGKIESQNTELINISTAMKELSDVVEKLNGIIGKFQM